MVQPVLTVEPWTPSPPAEYRAHLGTYDAIAAAPLVGTLAFVG